MLLYFLAQAGARIAMHNPQAMMESDPPVRIFPEKLIVQFDELHLGLHHLSVVPPEFFGIKLRRGRDEHRLRVVPHYGDIMPFPDYS